MSSIAIFKTTDDLLDNQRRFAGMQDAGVMMKEKLIKDKKKFRDAVVETLDTLIGDNDYDVRFLVKKKEWKLALIDGGGKLRYSVVNDGGQLKGILNLDIRRDEVFRLPPDADNYRVFEMTMNAPRRADEEDSWEYLEDNVVADLALQVLGEGGNEEAIDAEDRAEYLAGTLFFSRCD